MARITEVFPVPGAPHRSTGTRAAIATPSAWTTTACSSIPRQCAVRRRSVCQSRQVAGFDAERYLRLVGERVLLGEGFEENPWPSPLSGAARALVAVGAIDRDRARSVLDDYDLATLLRGDYRLHHRAWRRAAAGEIEAAVLERRRVVRCDREIEVPHGTLWIRYVS